MESSVKVLDIQLKDIHVDEEFNCRGMISPIDVVDLAKDIERQGLIQPVTVQPYSEEKAQQTGFKYKLLAGYRRTHAHRVLERETIPAIIHERMSDADAYIFNLAENVNRQDLNILQEAKALERLKRLSVPEQEVALRLGKSRGWVQIRYMLLSLPEEVQKEVAAGIITQTQIRELYTIFRDSGKDATFAAAKQIKEAKLRGRTTSVNPNKKKPTAKRHRKRAEINEMLEIIYDSIGPSFATRCLAWCSGEISSSDLYLDIKEQAEEAGKVFNIPE